MFIKKEKKEWGGGGGKDRKKKEKSNDNNNKKAYSEQWPDILKLPLTFALLVGELLRPDLGERDAKETMGLGLTLAGVVFLSKCEKEETTHLTLKK